MADNYAFSPSGSSTAASDDIGGVHYPRAKIVWGADGSANDTSAANPMPVVQTGALPAGTAAIGKLAANSGVDIGDVDVTSITVQTSGGYSCSTLLSANTTNATVAKASAGQVYAITAYNTNASARYLKFYNASSSPTVGSDTIVGRFTIPGSTAGGGLNFSLPQGWALSTGISYALTTAAADADTGAVATGEILVNVFYK